MNTNEVKGKWLEIKGEIQKKWGNLKNDELEKTKGDMKSVVGLIQQQYGEKKEDYEDSLSKIYDKFIDKKDEVVDKVKQSFK